MRLRTVASATVGALGTAAVANEVLSRRAGELVPPLPGEQRTYRWRGFDVAYTEAGDDDDPDLVLLHGINAAASSHEWKDVVEPLAAEYHVVTPDLPGFGRSDRPPLTYSAALYETFVRDFLTDVVDEPTVVAASLTGAYAASVADDVDASRYVLVCPTATTIPGERVWLRTLVRSPVVGEALYNLVASEASIRYFHDDHGYHDVANLDDETVEYEWQTAHQPGARFAPASFVSGHLDSDVDLAGALAAVDVPVTLVWGQQADMPPLSTGRDLATEADVRLVSVGASALVPYAEHPDEFIDVVSEA
jgi:pimeloyl-ACP methyl ester carboxylesterase